MNEQIRLILERIESEGLRYPLQVLPAWVPFASHREIVHDSKDLIAALQLGIALSPTGEVGVQEAWVLE